MIKSCICGGAIKIQKINLNGGMDGWHQNWEFYCSKCGLYREYPADGFYNRKCYSQEEAIAKWNEQQLNIEQRLKSDMVAMLTEILTDFDNLVEPNSTRIDCESIIEQKVQALEGNEYDNKLRIVKDLEDK